MFQSQSKEIWGWKRCKKSSEPASLILGTARGALAAAWSDLSSSRFIPSPPQSLTSSLKTRSSLRQRAQHATTVDQVSIVDIDWLYKCSSSIVHKCYDTHPAVSKDVSHLHGDASVQKIPSKLEVAPHALKMLTGWWMGDGWSGYPLDCYDC